VKIERIAGLVLLVAVLLVSMAHGEQTDFWPVGGGGIGDDAAQAVVLARSGDVVSVGVFRNEARFGDVWLRSEGLGDIYVLRQDPAGIILWVVGAGGAGADEATAVTMDDSGNIYLAGLCHGTVHFGSISLTADADGEADAFIAKIDPEGNWRWAKLLSGPEADEATGIVFIPGDENQIPPEPGSIVVSGRYRCDVGIDSLSLSQGSCPASGWDLFLLRLDTDGNGKWLIDGGSGDSGSEWLMTLTAIQDGRVLTAGHVALDTTVNGVSLDAWGRGWTFKQDDNSAWHDYTWLGSSNHAHQYEIHDDSTYILDDPTEIREAIDLHGAVTPVLSFDSWISFDAFPDPAAVLEVSTDDGASWQDIRDAGGVFLAHGYNDTVHEAGHPLDGRDCWSDLWYDTVKVDLSAFIGSTIRLRWRGARAVNPWTFSYWVVDNVLIQDGSETLFSEDFEEDVPGSFAASLSNIRSSSPSWNWVRQLPAGFQVGGIAASDTRVVIAGSSTGNIDTGSGMTVAGPGVAVLGLDPADGSLGWLEGNTGGAAHGLTIDSDGNFDLTGDFEGAMTIAGESLNSVSASRDIFVASIDPSGNWRWATGGDRWDPADGIPGRAGGDGPDSGLAIAAGRSAALIVAGSFSTTATFGKDEEVTAASRTDVVTAELDTSGRWFDFETWRVSEEVPPPSGAYLGSIAASPELLIDGDPAELGDYFYWQGPVPGHPDARLLALQPAENVEIRWRISDDLTDPGRVVSVGHSIWPENRCLPSTADACYQVHVVGAPVEIIPDDQHLSYIGVKLPYSNASDGAVSSNIFKASEAGYAVLEYVEGSSPDPTRHLVRLEVVRSYEFSQTPDFADHVGWPIGTEITESFHDEPGRTGWILNPNAYYDGAGGNAACRREARTGQIIPVNRLNPYRGDSPDREMTIVWYRRNHNRVYWGERPMRYDCYWPLDPEVIIVAGEKGGEVRGQAPLDPAVYPSATIYDQSDPARPGFNPNDEHALMAPSNTGSGIPAVFALRADFGRDLNPNSTDASDPYVLIKYAAPAGGWAFRIFKVMATSPDYPGFSFTGTAGTRIQPPYPLSLFPACEQTSVEGASGERLPPPFFRDVHEELWAASEGQGTVLYHYPLQAGFYYDTNGDDLVDASTGDCIGWMERLPQSMGGSASMTDPIPVEYQISWPEDVPLLEIGESLFKPKRGLPDIYDQAAVEVIYDELSEAAAAAHSPDPQESLAQIINAFEPRSVSLGSLPPGLATVMDDQGRLRITGKSDGSVRLPVTLRKRLLWDPVSKRLELRGLYDDSEAGEPLVLLNVMTPTERGLLRSLSFRWEYSNAVDALYRLSRNPQGIQRICDELRFDDNGSRVCTSDRLVFDTDVLIGWKDDDDDGILEPLRAVGGHPALTAGAARGAGFLTLAFNNDASLGSLPISLEVIRIGCLVSPPPPADPEITAPYMGEIKVLPPENVFDESMTLHFNGDFGGKPENVEFEWYYHPDEDGTPPEPPDPEHGQMKGWFAISLENPQGAQDVTIGGADLQTLSDNWYLARYRGLHACDNETHWSLWAGQPGSTPTDPRAQLLEGWVKRVVTAINPFEARVKDFHKAATNTYATMIEQLGPRYEGDIALNPSADNLNSIGLIEAYETVLHRARTLSIDGTPPVDYDPANSAILNVTSRLADFYLLLGNEAFADAEDPTVGISTDEVQFNIGSLAPTIFNFENQVPTLLDEELVLLRGRDDSAGPVAAPPVYNRFYWNFTGGNGEVAYALSYDIHDVNIDGEINAEDAKIEFPQGHGDAWGHDLTAITHYYELLRHPYFSWVPRPEAVLVAGVPIQVDYFDERKFASIAAARALAGAEIVNLTYRSAYTEDPAGQWQGYRDSDTQRAWGLDGWGKRAGQGAFFDWVTANAILPAEDTNPEHHGLSKIDRTTVHELDEIITHYDKIQAEIDAADEGLNPLGVAKNALLFDVDPAQVEEGKTHFEQIYDRAAQALDGAVSVWDYANELNRMLRFNQDDVQKMRDNSKSSETDFKNRLIEIFGYPYSDDIGPGGTYPDGYDGPDLYHYMYMDLPKLSGTGFDAGKLPGYIGHFTATYGEMPSGIAFSNINGDEPTDIEEECEEHATNDGCTLGDKRDFTLDVDYVYWQDEGGNITFIKPLEWGGRRRAQGKIQDALDGILNAKVAMEKAIRDYNALRGDVNDQMNLIAATYNIRADEISVANSDLKEIHSANATAKAYKTMGLMTEQAAESINSIFDIAKSCIPGNEIAGLADGGDLFSALRCSVKNAGWVTSRGLTLTSKFFEIGEFGQELKKEEVELQGAIYTRIDDARLELYGVKDKLDGLLRREPVLASEVFARAQQLHQAEQQYYKALAEGQRLLGRLVTFRKKTASAVQEYRYEDMAFRVFRNDALQKYRAAFDMAARYTYLAATAYDYDTGLLGTNGKSGQKFLTDIVRQQSLGQILDGEPVPGTPGLADPMGRMELDFDVLKGQMGFNNPEIEVNGMSLRHELLRLKDDDAGDAAWRKALEKYRVDDLWQVPEFRAMMQPFAPESAGPQPGLVIPFSSTVAFGLNFFTHPLGDGDHAFDSSRFATRIFGVGVGLGNYDTLGLAATPRVYLVPAGDDFLRAPTDEDGAHPVRQWKVLDQLIPEPFPINSSDLAQQGWTPLADMLDGPFGTARKFPMFRAYCDDESVLDEDQMDTRLISRSVWNSRWLLVIPGGVLLEDPNEALATFIEGREKPDGSGRDGNGVSDIRLYFKTYAYAGLK